MAIEHILMAYKGSPEEERVLQLLCRLARAWDAQLTLVHVVEVPFTLPVDSAEVPGLQEAERVLEHAEGIARKAKVQIHADLVQAREAGSGIVEEAEHIKADLIVAVNPLGKPSLPDAPLSRTLQYLLQHAPCALSILCSPCR